MNGKRENRVEKIVSDLLRGRRLKLRGGDAEGKAATTTGARLGGVRAFLFCDGDEVTAVSSICSHLPCELWWDGGHSHLVCPCHPATFAADGHPSDPYRHSALNKVYVRVVGGRVEVLGTE